MLIYHKSVDQSVLKAGMTIPTTLHDYLFDQLGFRLDHGESRAIKIRIDNEEYDAVLRNNNFNKDVYSNHTDVLQIRYNKTSKLPERLQEYFSYTQKLLDNRFEETGSRRLSGIDKKDLEYIAIYSTEETGILSFDCIRNQEFQAECHELTNLGEITAESILDGTDETAGILIRTQNTKIRKLNRQILSDLKVYYKYRCQICGEYIGERYGSNLIHAHHIDYFTRSLNNDLNNIMIVCPNHHGIIHDRNPRFDWKSLEYLYPNGYREGLRLNDHLKESGKRI